MAKTLGELASTLPPSKQLGEIGLPRRTESMASLTIDSTTDGRAVHARSQRLRACARTNQTSRVVFGVGFWELKPPPFGVACIVSRFSSFTDEA